MTGLEKAKRALQRRESGLIRMESNGFLVESEGACALWFRDDINSQKYREGQVCFYKFAEEKKETKKENMSR